MQPVASTRPSSASSSHDLHDDVMCTTHRRSSTSFEVKLGNPSSTFFTTKQAARCWHVFSHCLHPLKPPDVNACPHTIFIRSSVLRCKLTNLLPLGFEAQTKKPSQWFCGPNHQTTAADFEAQTGKPERVVLRPNHKNRSHQFLGQIRRNRRPWFWGWTKKTTIFVSLCTVQTAHGVTWPPNHSATEYSTCT
jgi:hypothetical protein